MEIISGGVYRYPLKGTAIDSFVRFGLVECLSKRVRDAVINGEEHTISDQCRVHLRVEKEEEVSSN